MDSVRTCIGCRSRAPKSQLFRVVASDGQLSIDRSGAAPGRGAWLHPSADCIAVALERKQFRRALRVDYSDETEVRAYQEQVQAKVVDRTMDQS